MWAMGREGEEVAELVAQFERAHPGVRVRVQQLPWSAAHEKLLTAFVGETLPDVAQLGNTWLSELEALGALEPLDAALERSQVVDARDYFPGIWATNVVGGATVGIPWYVDTRLLFYRRDLLAAAGYAEVPTTWETWRESLVAVARRAGPAQFAVFLPVNEFEQLLTLALSEPEPLLRDGGRWGNFRSASFGRALTYYLDLFRRQLAPVASETQLANVWDELGRGTFAFMIHGPWSIGELRRRLPAAQQGAWATAPMPGPRGPGAGIAGGSSLVLFRTGGGARRARLGWQLIEHLSTPAAQRRFFQLTGNLPPRRASWNDGALAADPAVAAFRSQLERARQAPAVPQWERIMQELRLSSERAVHQVRPSTTDAELAQIVADTCAELDERVDELLRKRRWMLARQEAR
ncbi:MAG: extracellular solute-binding protein [Myxococcales bacterium]|nr:extracellular solute-binding protein [Myxococcales bacterium]